MRSSLTVGQEGRSVSGAVCHTIIFGSEWVRDMSKSDISTTCVSACGLVVGVGETLSEPNRGERDRQNKVLRWESNQRIRYHGWGGGHVRR